MSIHNPTSGNAPGLPEQMNAEATKARIRQFCEWFDLEPPKLRTRLGRVYMTDELLRWFKESGASVDWIIYGGVKSMAAVAREKWLREVEFGEAVQRFNPKEAELLAQAIRGATAQIEEMRAQGS